MSQRKKGRRFGRRAGKGWCACAGDVRIRLGFSRVGGKEAAGLASKPGDFAGGGVVRKNNPGVVLPGEWLVVRVRYRDRWGSWAARLERFGGLWLMCRMRPCRIRRRNRGRNEVRSCAVTIVEKV